MENRKESHWDNEMAALMEDMMEFDWAYLKDSMLDEWEKEMVQNLLRNIQQPEQSLYFLLFQVLQ
jgi:hypothetical protein